MTPLDSTQGSVQVQLTNNGSKSGAFTMQLQSYAPGLFQFSGSSYAAATHANGSLLGPAGLYPGSTTPANPGEVITLYGNGFGQTAPPLVSGSATQTGILPTQPVVKIGGISATVQYAGVVAPGLYQLNVTVPTSVPAGDATLIATYNGVTSNTALLSVSGASSNGSLQIIITGLPSGTSGNVLVTSAGGFSTTVTSNQTLQVAPGTYTIVANSVPAGSVSYAAFPVQQSVAVAAGSANPVTVSYSIVVPNTTMVLDQQGSQGLIVAANGTTLTLPASSQTAQSLSPGSVLAIGSTPATPNGLLGKVISVSQSGSQVIVQTTQATLVDAFQQANFAYSITLTPQNTPNFKPSRSGVTVNWVSRQEVTAKNLSPASCNSDSSLLVEMFDTPILQDANGTLTVNGEIDVCPSLEFDWNLSAFPPRLNSLVAKATFGEAVHVNITGTYHSSFDKKVPVATITSDPLIVFVGPVPIVLTPVITFFVGVSGEANAGFSIGATQNASVTGGFNYANGQLTSVDNSSSSFSQDPIGLDANLSAKAYAGLTIGLDVDGVLSPEFSPDAYLKLDVNLLNNPWWTLSAGLEGDVSLKVGIFGVNLADFDNPNLFNFSKVIAQASGGSTSSSAAPVLNLVTPSSATAGSQGLSLTLTGLNFVPGATVSFNGASIATVYVSPTQLTATLPASALTKAGTFQVVVTNPDQAGATSLPFNFVVQPSTSQNPVPSITNLSPSSATAGPGPLTVAINGTGFLPTSTVTFNGTAHAATFVTANQLTISLGSADLSTAGTFPVVVTNPPPGGGNSQPVFFTVQPAPATATLQSLTLTPATVVGGGSVTGTITLSGPAPTSGVQVSVSSSSPLAQVPTFVSVSSGQSSATFTITTTLVSSSQSVTISAVLAGVTRTANLTVITATVTATVIYAGTDTGIYRSSDGGVTWQPTSLTWPQASFSFVYGIVVDPSNRSNVYASGTNYSATDVLVFYRSTDAGQTWSTAAAPTAGLLALDAVSTNVIYLGSASGLYRSTDSGVTWNPTQFAGVIGVTADPTLSGVVYASAEIPAGFGLYKSTNFGDTWTLLATNLNLPGNDPGFNTSITIDPHNSSTLYATGEGFCVPGDSSSVCSIFKSTNGGSSWQNLRVQGTYSNVAIDYTTGVLYAGGTLTPYFGYVVKSSDGGNNWTPINTGLTTTSVVVFTDPGNSSNLFAVGGSAGGQYYSVVFRSTNGGASWTSTQIGPSGGQVLSFGIPAK